MSLADRVDRGRHRGADTPALSARSSSVSARCTTCSPTSRRPKVSAESRRRSRRCRARSTRWRRAARTRPGFEHLETRDCRAARHHRPRGVRRRARDARQGGARAGREDRPQCRAPTTPLSAIEQRVEALSAQINAQAVGSRPGGAGPSRSADRRPHRTARSHSISVRAIRPLSGISKARSRSSPRRSMHRTRASAMSR